MKAEYSTVECNFEKAVQRGIGGGLHILHRSSQIYDVKEAFR